MIDAAPDRRRLVLGIETSCDETAAAVADGVWRVRGAAVAVQHDLHQTYGGVVPEIASRAHLERMLPVIRRALDEADATLADLDAIAVGHRPGLIGALLVGTSAAKGLGIGLGVPLIGVDHVHAHLLSGLLIDRDDAPRASLPLPAIGLVVSGGHTNLYDVEDPTEPRRLGRTIDDAIGEAFDKVGAMLGLPHPGGPGVERLAADGDPEALALPVANLGKDRLDFSFSGLKTAVRYAALGAPGRDAPPLSDARRADVAASFQRAAIAALRRNLRRAIDRLPEARGLLVGGGVVANAAVRRMLAEEAERGGLDLVVPDLRWCQDNGAMIAALGALRLDVGKTDPLTLVPSATTRT